jgi:hypothetical protein
MGGDLRTGAGRENSTSATPTSTPPTTALSGKRHTNALEFEVAGRITRSGMFAGRFPWR